MNNQNQTETEFKNLGITKMTWIDHNITIERENGYGTTIVKRSQKRLPPRRELSECWQSLKRIVTNCVFDGEDVCAAVETITFACGQDNNNDEIVYDLLGVGVKGVFEGKHTGTFVVKIMRDDMMLTACKRLYELAADYYDGKNAQLEFSATETAENGK